MINGLSVSDVDAGASPITTQFAVAHATLSVDTTGGVPQPSGAILLPNGVVITGNGTNTLTILGSTAQISSELSLGLTYTPTSGYVGGDTLTMTSNDLGATGVLGGPQKDVSSVAITVVAVSSPPVNVVPVVQSTNEDIPLVISGLSVSDAISGSNPITTEFTVAHGTLSVNTTGGVVQPSGAILLPDGTVITGKGTSTLTILGSTAEITNVLSQGLTYSPTFAYFGPDTLTMTSNDLGISGIPLTDVDTVAITVAPVVHAPTLTVTTPTSGLNGFAIPISFSGTLTDANKPEVLTYTVSGVPTAPCCKTVSATITPGSRVNAHRGRGGRPDADHAG